MLVTCYLLPLVAPPVVVDQLFHRDALTWRPAAGRSSRVAEGDADRRDVIVRQAEGFAGNLLVAQTNGTTVDAFSPRCHHHVLSHTPDIEIPTPPLETHHDSQRCIHQGRRPRAGGRELV